MAEPRKQYPFVVRALFFAIIYTVIAVVSELLIQWSQDGAAQMPTTDKVGRYFLIGLVVASLALLFLRRRRPNLPR